MDAVEPLKSQCVPPIGSSLRGTGVVVVVTEMLSWKINLSNSVFDADETGMHMRGLLGEIDNDAYYKYIMYF